MRCLYCGKKLALLRKLTDNEFCSNSHRKLYQQEQEKMALSRLVEAQDRFSSFTPPPVAPKPKANGVRREPVVSTDDEIRGFLAMPPNLQVLEGMRKVSSSPELPLGDPMLPPLQTMWRGEPRQCTEPVEITFELRFCETKPLHRLEPLPEPAFTAVKPGSRANLEIAGLTVSGQQAWLWEPAAMEYQSKQVESTPYAFELACQLPASNLILGESLPQPGRIPLDASPLEDFRPLTPALTLAECEMKPLKSFARDTLSVIAPPLPGSLPEFVEEEATPPAKAEVDDIPSGLVRFSGKEKPLSRDLPMRKTRVREVFFPLPQLGGLSTMAAGVARASAVNDRPRTFEIAAKPWIVQTSFDPQPQAFETRRSADSFSFIDADASKPQSLPLASLSVRAASENFAMAGRLDMPDFGFAAGKWDMRRMSAELAELETPAPVWPTSHVPLLAGIGVGERLPMDVPEVSVSVAGHRTCDLVWAETLGSGFEHVQYPVSTHAAREPGMRGVSALAAIEGIGHGDCVTSRANIEPQHVDALPLPIVCPVSTLTQDFAPAAIAQRCIFYDSSWGTVVSPRLDVPTRIETTPFYPEPARLMPRLRTSVVEDHKVREAARAALAMFGEAKHGWTSRIHIPMPALPTMPQMSFGRPDLKWFMMLVPLILLIGVYNLFEHDTPVQTAAVAVPAEGPQLPVAAAMKEGNFVTVGMENVKQTIKRRAAISLSDDFRGGLADWEGRGDWSKNWSYDQAGFLRTGPLALYQPSMKLSDYHMDFLGQIEKRSISWVYRAVDFDNYYVSKITLTHGGPLPQAIIERYAVINGKQSSYAKRPLPMMVQTDTLYRVRMDVQGGDFTLLVQGQTVDHWSDNRLKQGGVGFFSAKGDLALLRWVEISHQYDMLGKLCAFLAPYSIPAREGSLK